MRRGALVIAVLVALAALAVLSQGCAALIPYYKEDQQRAADKAACEKRQDAEACHRLGKLNDNNGPRHWNGEENEWWKYEVEACRLGQAEACNGIAPWLEKGDPLLARGCDLGAGRACNGLARYEANPKTRDELRVRACRLDPVHCFSVQLDYDEDFRFIYRLAEIVCADESARQECTDVHRHLIYLMTTCPKDEPTCTLPQLSRREACIIGYNDACIAIGREVSRAAKP